jgi:inorganic pyrophosphatase
MLPQTWENPEVKLADTEIGGDNDPLDVVELSDDALPLGAVVPVRVVGALGLIDEGELDWKLLAIANDHPLAHQLNGRLG